MPLNNFITASNLIEFLPVSGASANSTSSSATVAATTTASVPAQNKINGTTNVMAMGEFALLEPELVKVQRVLDQKVNVTAIHNHMVMENPKLINVHWETHGTVNTIIQLVKQALAQTSIMSGAAGTTNIASNSTTTTNMTNTGSTPSKTTNSTSPSSASTSNNTGTTAGQKSSAANMTRLTGGPANNSNGTSSTAPNGSNNGTNPLNNLGKSLQNLFGGGNKK
jgi:hypothetical protein